MTQAKLTKKGRFDGPAGLAVVVVVVVVGAMFVERLTRPSYRGESMSGPVMPPLVVGGWLNTGAGPAPSVESLRGKHVIVDCWATWCGPCIKSMPRLAKLYDRWEDRGVTMIGLTAEPATTADTIQATLERVGADWPVAYGAGMVHGQLNVSMIPDYILFDPEGRAVWRGHMLEGLEAELAARL